MSTLFVVGNGFDLHHGLDTRYSSYGAFLSNNDKELYECILKFFALPDINHIDADSMWSDFESALAELDSEVAFDRSSDFVANPGSPDFRDRDWGAFAIEIERFVSMITDGIYETFWNFILSQEYPDSEGVELLDIDRDARFISFNYTDTLTRYYAVAPSRILHIHGRAGSVDHDIVIGHGIDPDNFIDEPEVPPYGLSDEDLEQWRQYKSDQYDHSFELGKQELQRYFKCMYKCTADIILKNESYFASLSDVNCVYIIGHSLSDIDIEYFERLALSVSRDATWHVSYYMEHEEESHVRALCSIGVDANMINPIRVESLKA